MGDRRSRGNVARLKGLPVKPSDLFPKARVEDDSLRGADGRLIRRGLVVRRPARFSESLKATVPTRVGRVVDIYVQNGRTVVEVVNGEGRAYFAAERVRRSAAEVAS